MTKAKYKKEFCKMVVDHMSKGLSFQTFTLVAKVDKATLYRWIVRYPAFKKAKEEADNACLNFFEKILSAKTSGQSVPGFDPKKSDTTLLIFALKTRFYKIYGDKKQIEVNHSGNIDSKVDQVDYSRLTDEQLNTMLEITSVAKKEK